MAQFGSSSSRVVPAASLARRLRLMSYALRLSNTIPIFYCARDHRTSPKRDVLTNELSPSLTNDARSTRGSSDNVVRTAPCAAALPSKRMTK